MLKKTLLIACLIGVAFFTFKYGEIAWRYIDKGYGARIKMETWNKRIEGLHEPDTLAIRWLLKINSSISPPQRGKLERLINDSLLLDGYYSRQLGTWPDVTSPKLINAYHLQEGRWLVTSEYRNPFGEQGLCVQLAVVDLMDNSVCSQKIVPGGKYHPVEVAWTDIDNDGKKEILCQLIHPTSSIPVLEHFDVIFELNTHYVPIEVLNVTTASMDCASRHLSSEKGEENLGHLTHRNYVFETPLKLKMTEERFLFDCAEFGDSFISSKKIVATETNYFERTNNAEKFKAME